MIQRVNPPIPMASPIKESKAPDNNPGESSGSGNMYEDLSTANQEQEPNAESTSVEEQKNNTHGPSLKVLPGGKAAITQWVSALVGLTKKIPIRRSGSYNADFEKSKGVLCDKKAE